jgi:hypothetical protein
MWWRERDASDLARYLDELLRKDGLHLKTDDEPRVPRLQFQPPVIITGRINVTRFHASDEVTGSRPEHDCIACKTLH